jgi:hypothetical protein
LQCALIVTSIVLAIAKGRRSTAHQKVEDRPPINGLLQKIDDHPKITRRCDLNIINNTRLIIHILLIYHRRLSCGHATRKPHCALEMSGPRLCHVKPLLCQRINKDLKFTTCNLYSIVGSDVNGPLLWYLLPYLIQKI